MCGWSAVLLVYTSIVRKMCFGTPFLRSHFSRCQYRITNNAKTCSPGHRSQWQSRAKGDRNMCSRHLWGRLGVCQRLTQQAEGTAHIRLQKAFCQVCHLRPLCHLVLSVPVEYAIEANRSLKRSELNAGSFFAARRITHGLRELPSALQAASGSYRSRQPAP